MPPLKTTYQENRAAPTELFTREYALQQLGALSPQALRQLLALRRMDLANGRYPGNSHGQVIHDGEFDPIAIAELLHFFYVTVVQGLSRGRLKARWVRTSWTAYTLIAAAGLLSDAQPTEAQL